MRKRKTSIAILLVIIISITITLIASCASTADQATLGTLTALSTENARLATEVSRQEELVQYLATRGPFVSTPIPSDAEPTPFHPVVGSVEIEDGRCCVQGVAGETLKLSVRMEAVNTIPDIPVTEMRVWLGNQPASEEALTNAEWEPFAETKVFTADVGLNWIGYTISVQFRDAQGNLSEVFYDEIAVEGVP